MKGSFYTKAYQEGSNLDRTIRKGFSKEGPLRASTTEWWIWRISKSREEAGIGESSKQR